MNRDQTIEILNEADNFSRRLDWMIFNQETAVDYSEPGWVPGDPIYDRPRSWISGTQYIRYMIEDIPEGRFNNSDRVVPPYAYCKSCEVFWSAEEEERPCWICGKHSESRDYWSNMRMSLDQLGTTFNVEVFGFHTGWERSFSLFYNSMRSTYIDLVNRGTTNQLYADGLESYQVDSDRSPNVWVRPDHRFLDEASEFLEYLTPNTVWSNGITIPAEIPTRQPIEPPVMRDRNLDAHPEIRRWSSPRGHVDRPVTEQRRRRDG